MREGVPSDAEMLDVKSSVRLLSLGHQRSDLTVAAKCCIQLRARRRRNSTKASMGFWARTVTPGARSARYLEAPSHGSALSSESSPRARGRYFELI